MKIKFREKRSLKLSGGEAVEAGRTVRSLRKVKDLLRLRPAKSVEVFGRIVIRAKILAKMVQTLQLPAIIIHR